MESNSWRPAQTEAPSMEVPSADWRSQLLPEARQRIVNKIMDTLRRHLPVAVPEGMNELQKIALRFEEKIYTVAVNQSDYLRKISLKMLSMESKTPQAAPLNPQPGVIQNSTDTGSVGVPSQVNNQVQTMSTISVVNQPPVRQQLLPQNLQNNAAASMQVSSSLSASPSIPGRSQSTLPHYAQTSNMQSMPGMSHNAVNNSLPQGSASDIYANATRQMQPRPQPQSILSQQQQQQTQGPLLYQNQLQSQLSKQKIHNNALLQQPIQQQQQQQQSLLQTNQLQPSQQTMMQMSSSLPSGQSSIQQSQPASVQSAPQSTLQQNHLNSIQQSVPSLHPQHVQAIARQTQQAQPSMHQQTSSLQQQAASIHQQSNLQTQQHQQLMGQQANLSNISSISNISNVSNIANIQHNQLLGQQNNIADIKPQQQRLPVQQNNLVNMQQSQPLLNQQTLSLHPQQLGQQTNMQGLPQQLQPQNQQQQQQPLLASLPNVSNMQTHQRSMQLLQQSKNMPQSQQQLQPSMSLLQSQGQQSHHQSSQQQLMSQIHSQSGQLQQQQNSMQREVQQRLQAPGALLQPQSAIEQQKQFVQSQRGVPEVSSVTSMDSTAQTGHISGDWQEELYQKIQSLKEEHLAELQGFHQKITLRIQQHDTMPHSKQSANYERLKSFKMFLEQIMAILQIPKNNIPISLKEKLPMYESHINSLLSSRKSKVMPLQQPGQLQLQNQLQTSQVSQVQQHDSMGNQVQQINMPGSVTSMHTATASSVPHGSMTISGLAASMTQQSLINSVQSSSSFDAVQTSSFSSLQHGTMGTVQQSVMGPSQNSLGATQQTNLNGLSQSSIGALQPNASSIQNSSVLQQQHLKQQQEHVIQNQQLKQQLQQRQMQQQQVFHQQQRQQQLQQPQQPLQQQQKQQPASQLPVHQISQLHPMNELNELKARPVAGIKAGLYQQPYPGGQRQNYYHQQLKPSPSFPISSPQNLQASSPQISHNSSPQIDQHNLLPMLTKSGTPMQSTGSPFVVQSPSTPIARSPIPGDSEKLVSCLVSLPTTGQSIHQQCSAPTQAQSIAVATPGMSASPLLAEFPTIEVNQPVMSSSKTSASDRPLERLIKAVRSFSPKALSSAVSDIGSVVSMIDRIAGSAPGNGSRAAVGEDLVAMTKCRLQARNFMSQDGGASTKKIKRQTSAMPLNNVSACSVNDNFVLFHSLDSSDLESTATSRVKRSKVEAKHSLQEEIREINQHLIDTVVSICDEDSDSFAAAAASGEGIIVKCYFSAVAFSPSLKAHFALMHTDPIAPLKLLVPANYPKGSPQLLDKPSVEHSKEFEDLSVKAKSTFTVSLRSLSQPMSLGEMVRTWDACARKVIVEYAQQSGGGSFSSSYGTWHNCVGA